MKFRLVTDGYHICILKRFFIWETEVLRVEYSEENLFRAIDYLNQKNDKYYGR
jgi:hypothetical protein|tara:strand:- start:401 stop:559 length:159 start_codon:yes stop_codon:yes gene_type:complete